MPATKYNRRSVPESSVAFAGLVLAAVGLALQDSLGITSLVAALGLAFVVAGTAYVATEAARPIRLAVVFVALVGAQLLAFGGAVRLVGAVLVGVVLVAAGYSRL
jgi:hypothetical protein